MDKELESWLRVIAKTYVKEYKDAQAPYDPQALDFTSYVGRKLIEDMGCTQADFLTDALIVAAENGIRQTVSQTERAKFILEAQQN